MKKIWRSWNSTLRARTIKQELERQMRKELKMKLVLKTGGRCQTCGNKSWLLDLSHIVPLSQGGETTEENTLLECRRCHQKRHHQIKGD